MPTVALPAPKMVKGPRNRPKGIMTANAIHSTSVLVGTKSPITAWKKGAAIPEARLNIGKMNRKPNSDATSTTPS